MILARAKILEQIRPWLKKKMSKEDVDCQIYKMLNDDKQNLFAFRIENSLVEVVRPANSMQGEALPQHVAEHLSLLQDVFCQKALPTSVLIGVEYGEKPVHFQEVPIFSYRDDSGIFLPSRSALSSPREIAIDNIDSSELANYIYELVEAYAYLLDQQPETKKADGYISNGHTTNVRFQGFVDDLSDRSIHGWIIDRQNQSQSAYAAIIYENGVLAVVKISGHREDVAVATGYRQDCQVNFEFPLWWDGDAAKLDVVAIDAELAKLLELKCGVRDRSTRDLRVEFDLELLLSGRSRPYRLPHVARAIEAAEQSSHSPLAPSGQRRLIFDISDLIIFFQHHRRVSGIQRTECGIISGLARSNKADLSTFEFCVLSDKFGFIQVLCTSKLNEIIEGILSSRLEMADIRERLSSLLQSSTRRRVLSSDNLLILGAMWTVPQIEAKIREIKRSNAVLGMYIYDFIPVTHPQYFDRVTELSFRGTMAALIPMADYIITISEHVKNEVSRVVAREIGETKPISASPLPHELLDFGSTPHLSTSIERGKFVLCVGTIEPRKNHRMLYRIWAELIHRYGFDAVPSLVLVGRWGWNMDDFKLVCEQSKYLNGKIILRNNLGDDELSELFQSCLLTVFPSFNEGWGLPVGESLAYGKLCVASRAASIPEVGGDLVDYIDPNNFEDALISLDRAIYDDNYRTVREIAISQSFHPRTWLDTAADLVAKSRGMVEGLSAEYRRETVVPPKLQPGSVGWLNDLQSDDTRSWRDKFIRYILADGWGPLESWGVWSAKPEALISFGTPFESGTLLKIWLLLCLPNEYQGEQIEIVSGDEFFSLTDRGVGGAPRWFCFQIRAGHDGRTTLSIRRPTAFASVDDISRSARFVGLSGMCYHAESDLARENQFLRQALAIVSVPAIGAKS